MTGAAGFIGGHVVRALRARGHGVVAVDALIEQAHGAGHPAPEGVERLDVAEADQWRGRLAGVDVVCHQAAMVGAGTSVRDLPGFARHNDLGTAVTLAAMGEAGVGALVLASSMVVYGEGCYTCPEHGPQRVPPRSVTDLDAGRFDSPCQRCGRALDWGLVGEDAPLEPRGGYAAAKVAQEHYAAAWARQTAGRSIALRYHNVYGPGMPRSSPYSGVAALFRSAVERGEAPQVYEDGGQMRDFVHVDDAAAANVRAVEAVGGGEPGAQHAYNVCSGHPVSILDVARHVVDGAGLDLEPVVSGAYRPSDVRHIVASPERARRELGMTACVPPEQGLAAFAREPLRD